MRKICISRETEFEVRIKQKEKYIYSQFPVDRYDCECQGLIKEKLSELSMMSERERQERADSEEKLVCPRSKKGLKHYKIVCNNCNNALGFVWSSDVYLSDWCDFHYVNYTFNGEWKGCLTPHISPIDGRLCLECTCGQDTRDFRANMTLPSARAYEIEMENKLGREFGQSNSKFRLELVKSSQVRVK